MCPVTSISTYTANSEMPSNTQSNDLEKKQLTMSIMGKKTKDVTGCQVLSHQTAKQIKSFLRTPCHSTWRSARSSPVRSSGRFQRVVLFSARNWCPNMRFYDISILNVWHWDIDEHIKIRFIHPVQSDHYFLGDKSPIDLSGSSIARPKLSHAPALALLPRARGAWKKSGTLFNRLVLVFFFSAEW